VAAPILPQNQFQRPVSNLRIAARSCHLAAGLLLCAAPALALDPDRAVSQYVLTRWSSSGLPGGAVLSLCQTKDDYLWMGTAVGLARFDGARLTTFDPRHTRGLAEGGISQLAEGRDGTLFLGTTHGVALRYKEGVFSRTAAPDGAGDVRAMISAADGTLWVSAHGRSMYRVDGEKASSVFRAIGAEVPLAIAEDAAGAIWMGTWRDGLVRYAKGEFTRHRLIQDTVLALHVDRAGAIWIGTPHGLYRWKEGEPLRHFTGRDGLSHESISAILEDRSGNLWVGTRGGGLNRFHGGRFARLGTREGLSDDDVRCLLEDREGNLWVGTADGLNSLSDGRFMTYGTLEGLPDPAVPSVAAGADGTVWMGDSSATLTRLKGGALTHLRLPAGIGRESIIALYEDRRGTVWISVENGRLFRLDGSTIAEETPKEMAANWKVSAIYEDDEGPLFYVSHFGLARIRHRALVAVHPQAPRFHYVHCLARDAAGTLWMGTSRGLAQVVGSAYRVFHTGDGLPHERVRSLSVDREGGVWAATIGGLAYVKNETVHALTTDQGLPEAYLRLVLDDGLGHLWIGAGGQVFRLDKNQIQDVFAGRAAEVTPVAFDSSDGLRTTEAILSNSPGARSPDGRLWFATARGVSVVDPARFDADDPAPAARIESVVIDDLAERRTEYPPGRGEVSIEYAALRFRAPGKVRFRYRMDGFDHGWVEAGTRRSAYYSNLPPGHYLFTVMASNGEGQWNGAPAVFEMSLKPPFYRTAAFYLLCAAALVALAVGVHRVRVGQMSARFTAIVSERTRIARELHDTLAQGLAGVGFQIDTALDRLPDEPGVGRVRQHMMRARRMVRSSLAEVRRSIWVLRTQTTRDKDGFSQSLAESLEHLTLDSPLRTQLVVLGARRTLSAEVERSLLRVAHEAVTNAVRHAQAANLTVELRFEPEALHLRVRDDGRGFDPDTTLAAAEGEHFGLTGIVERVRALGGQAHLTSRPGAGTEIVCEMPYDCPVETAEVESIEGITL
jgi:signal transduction histidine kinase/ligand-binding sensor domain-containing protein